MTRVRFGFFEGESQSGGYTISVGEITTLHKQIGDVVEKGDVIADVDTDKAKIEILAPVSGVVCSHAYKEGEEWNKDGEVKTPYGMLFLPEIGEIETDAVQCGTDDTDIGKKDLECTSIPQGSVSSGVETCGDVHKQCAQDVHPTNKSSIVPTIPSARVLGRGNNVDLKEISSTGHDGIIQHTDVVRAIIETSSMQGVLYDTEGEITLKTSMTRKTVARLLEHSQRTIPQAGGCLKIDVTNLYLFRKNCNTRYSEAMSCVKLRYDHVFMYLAIKLLAKPQFSILNGYWDENKKVIVQPKNINIGIAVNACRGLVVPVIHRAGELSFVELIRVVEDKINRANNGALLPQDFHNLTFTVNNAGVLGVEIPDPIVPSITVGDGVIRSTGMVVALGSIVPQDNRYYMYLAFKFDHRLVDAREPSMFTGAIKQFVESRGKPEDLYELFDEGFSP